MSAEAFSLSSEYQMSEREVWAAKNILIEGFRLEEPNLPLHLVIENVGEINGRETALRKRPLLAVSFLEEIYNDYSDGKRSLGPRPIIDIVAENYDVTYEDIIGRSKKNGLPEPRLIAMYLARRHTDLSFQSIANVFEGRDHTTIVNAVNRIEDARKAKTPQAKLLNQKLEHIESVLVDPARELTSHEKGCITPKLRNKLVALSSEGLVVCPWADVGDKPKALGLNNQLAIDWREMRQYDDLYRMYGNAAYKLLQSSRRQST